MPAPRKKKPKQPTREQQGAPEKNPFLTLLSEVQPAVDARLASYLDRQVRESARLGPEVGEMVKALADLCRRGGKRMRPALLVAGFRSASPRANLRGALDAGVALELLQAYFLIHDDWMDGDLIRRGGPTVHAWLSRRLGSPQLGAAGAILAGDYAQALAVDVLSTLDLAPKQGPRVFSAFAEMQLAAVSGQQIDLVGTARDVEAAYELKTGSYTVLGPLKMGAILADASPRALTTLERVARPLGIGFQLRDDLLSAFGDPKRTGKPLGNDLKSGKRTVLLLETLRRTRGTRRSSITRVLGNPRAKKADLQHALTVMDDSGARAAVEARVLELAEQARKHVGSAISNEGASLLRGAIRALTERQA
jgi:geranylgeranyl diphosphate synthase type I